MFKTALFAVASIFVVTWCAEAESYLQPGFVMERWLTGAGDLRGVTVGPGGDYGSDPFVVSRDTQSILRVTGKDTFEVFATGLSSGTGRIAFDPSGSFGGDMFVSNPFDMVGDGDPVYRISSAGNTSLFFKSAPWESDLLMKGIAFGGGTGFGTDLYVMDAETQCVLSARVHEAFAEAG